MFNFKDLAFKYNFTRSTTKTVADAPSASEEFSSKGEGSVDLGTSVTLNIKGDMKIVSIVNGDPKNADSFVEEGKFELSASTPIFNVMKAIIK